MNFSSFETIPHMCLDSIGKEQWYYNAIEQIENWCRYNSIDVQNTINVVAIYKNTL